MSTFPLSPIEKQAKTHAILATTGFLILLPLGTLIPRYTRTFTTRWFWAHAAFQFLLAGPIILAGWYYGHKTCEDLSFPHFTDPHQRMGLTLLILYVAQLMIGVLVHLVKIPTLGVGRRPLQNYFHAFLGLVIMVLAASQVHYGLYTEWDYALGGLHHIPRSAKNAWLALVVVFWILYLAGLALLPRQFRQERKNREAVMPSGSGSSRSDSDHGAA